MRADKAVATFGTTMRSLAIARLTARGRLVVQHSGITVAEPPSSHWAEAAIVAPLVAEDPGYGQDVLEIRRRVFPAVWKSFILSPDF